MGKASPKIKVTRGLDLLIGQRLRRGKETCQGSSWRALLESEPPPLQCWPCRTLAVGRLRIWVHWLMRTRFRIGERQGTGRQVPESTGARCVHDRFFKICVQRPMIHWIARVAQGHLTVLEAPRHHCIMRLNIFLPFWRWLWLLFTPAVFLFPLQPVINVFVPGIGRSSEGVLPSLHCLTFLSFMCWACWCCPVLYTIKETRLWGYGYHCNRPALYYGSGPNRA